MGKLVRFRRKEKPRDEAERTLFPPFRAGASLNDRPTRGGRTDARPADWFASDASPAPDMPRAGTGPDPEAERKRRLRRRSAIAAAALVFVGGLAAAMFGDRGYLDVRRQRQQYRGMKDGFRDHLVRVQVLQHEVQRLKRDPAAVERIAREELGYVAPEEVTLLLPGEAASGGRRLDSTSGSDIVPAVRDTH